MGGVTVGGGESGRFAGVSVFSYPEVELRQL
jgi:hypothetical protein